MFAYVSKESSNGNTFPNRHIYYEPPEEFEFDATSFLLPNTAGEVIVHRLPTSPDTKPDSNTPPNNPLKECSLPSDTPSSELSTNNTSYPKEPTSGKEQQRAYTKEEFTCAILARTQNEEHRKSCPALSPSVLDEDQIAEVVVLASSMGESGVASMVRDSLTTNGQSLMAGDGRETCDCERRCSNPKHSHECKSGDYGVSPILERRNKGVLGRLRNFASRTSYSTSEDGHSHSSDYEDQEEDRKIETRFSRDARERSSSSWAGRVRDLHRDVKKKISRLRNSKGITQDDDMCEGNESGNALIQRGSSVESLPSGSGSSLQPPTPTSSNRSSTSAGEDDHNPYVGTFIGRARALVDCTPSPYDRDGLAFKKGDIIDIIAKHKTGIWVGMAQGKVGHFKFINVEEIDEERKTKLRRRKVNNEWSNSVKKPETLEELLKQLDLEEYTNVLVLNGYDELDTFKEIEKVDLDNLGIINPEHCSKLLRAVEMLQDVDPDAEEMEDDESQIKQSPRDSGCYASHENLVHRDSSQRALSNGQFVVDLEDQDTSHSESGIHSREGQDSALTMNNLDISVESSTKSNATTMDDMAGVTDTNDCMEDIHDHSNYNILPTVEDISINNGNQSIVENTPEPVEVFVAPQFGQESALNVPYFLSHSGTKSSPGSPRKTRTKHSRNKSHSHRSRDLFNDFSLNFHSYTFTKGRELSIDACPDRSGYVYGWASFYQNEKGSRKNLHEYDDVVSDPATEVEDSPGRYVYKKVKQRKGSLQTLIHDTRPPSPTLISKVNKKLVAEKIYLHEEPYTDKTGFCGIPPALVQRYAEELQHSIVDVADALDQIRITSLQQQGRRGVPNDFLSDSCIVPVIEPNYSSLQSWLTSLGLPMYLSNFESCGVTELHHVATLNEEDLAHLGVRNSYHQVYLESAIGALFMRYRRRPQTYPQGPSIA
ncbi:SAM and SH3 domain-containing protein 1 [Trichonephila inaurata madagascariensis]|uniref:SAM and SH3 domain-containing protein 1 n=1 Tax=Trichonephila inaurata madagascariensis TaxID=2747483 RepID=A0A8X6XPE7_9ARAC|nr:SAM and SH3 domain-containing protein 1 [Trichonephila inaurata madagascariensis]